MSNKSAGMKIYGQKKPIEVPLYSVSEVAHHLGMPRSTVNSWVAGQSNFSPVISPARPGLMSFQNLVEVFTLSSLRKYGVKLAAVRKAIQYLRSELRADHPLAIKQFSTDGHSLFIEKYGELVNVSEAGQLAMKKVLGDYLKRLQYGSDGSPIRLFPLVTPSPVDSRRAVVIDPEVLFGRPCITGTRIPTDIVAERYKAGDTIAELAKDYGRTPSEIEDALRYEFPERAA